MNTVVPAAELAARNTMRFPNESIEYRRARQALLTEEIELRRHIERVAEQRRALPRGGEVTGDYRFIGEHGETDFAGLFGDKQTLVIYSWMYGPQRERPCPMCTSLLSAWDGEARDVEQNAALAVIARSPIERLTAFKRERGWRHLKIYSDANGHFSRDYSPSHRMAATSPPSTYSPAATARSAISGVARWVSKAPIPARTLAAPPT